MHARRDAVPAVQVDAEEDCFREEREPLVTCQRRSATTISTGMAMPMAANTMWNASDTPIWERAARRSDMASQNTPIG